MFEAIKTLIILGVKVNEDFTDEERKKILEKKDDSFIFETYDFGYGIFDKDGQYGY